MTLRAFVSRENSSQEIGDTDAAACREIPMMYMVILLTGALLGHDLLDLAARLRAR